MILDKIDKLLKEVSTLSAKNAEEIEQLRLKYLSKKGEISALMADFREVSADQKKAVGMKINELKQMAIAKINELKEQHETDDDLNVDLDLTRSAYPIALGTRHPLTIVRNQIIDIFQRMGFTLAEGPEIDDDLHVFTKLNFDAGHLLRRDQPQRCDKEHHSAFAHQQRPEQNYGEATATNTCHLPRTCVP